MTSVSPLSSVSRSDFGERDGLEVPQAPFLILEKVVGVVGKDSAVEVVKAYYSALAKYYDAVAADSGASVHSEVPLSVGSVVSSRASSASRRRARRRAAMAAVVAGRVDRDDPELSYLRLFSPVWVHLARQRLGMRPTLGGLMMCPAEWFLPLEELSAVTCEVGSSGVAFVDVGGTFTVGEVMSHVSSVYKTPQDTMGSLWFPRAIGLCVVEETYVGDVGLKLSRAVVSIDEDGSSVQASGYCYLQLVKPDYRAVARGVLGPAPVLTSLLKLPADMFQLDGLDIGVDFASSTMLHVNRGGDRSFGRLAATVVDVVGLWTERCSLALWLRGRYSIYGAYGAECTMWRLGASVVDSSVPDDVDRLSAALAALVSLNIGDFDLDKVQAVSGRGSGFGSGWIRRALVRLGASQLESGLYDRALQLGVDAVQRVLNHGGSILADEQCARCFDELGVRQYICNGELDRFDVRASLFRALVALVYTAGSVEAVSELLDHTSFRLQCEELLLGD